MEHASPGSYDRCSEESSSACIGSFRFDEQVAIVVGEQRASAKLLRCHLRPKDLPLVLADPMSFKWLRPSTRSGPDAIRFWGLLVTS